MEDNLTLSKECSVYPGEYIPLPEMEALVEESKNLVKDSDAKPPVNMSEFEDYFKIEVPIPGVRREYIVIYTHENILSIVVLNKYLGKFKNEKLRTHEFDSRSFERHILLPEDADTEFVSATYGRGILNFHIPKTKEPSTAKTTSIVVYPMEY